MTDQAPAAYLGPTRVVSGIQSSGALHLGNYLGALKKFVGLQSQKDRLDGFAVELGGQVALQHDRFEEGLESGR